MEATRYRRLCRLIDQLSPHPRRRRQQFSDASVVKVYFYSTQHDRPVCWACQTENWEPRLLHETVGFTLPSQPTMSRRLRTVGVLQLIERVQVRLAEALQEGPVKVIDSKPLKVGSYSKDRDAKRGRAAGEKARGYKLHAIISGKAFICWTLTAMNVNDQVPAVTTLLPQLAQRQRGDWGYVIGDNGYDANAVYRCAATVANHQLVAPPRASNAHVRDVRRNSKERIRSLDICACPLQHCGLGSARASFPAALRASRTDIERCFGNTAMDGMYAPPPWVRTPRRTATWVAMKLIQRMLRQLEIAGVTM